MQMLSNLTDPCTIQEDINRIEKWCSDNELKLNSDKCYILPIQTKCEIDNLTLNANRLSCKKRTKRSRYYNGDELKLESTL